jgi:hypothetical protein
MMQLRPANERGHHRMSWLDTWHSFTFDTYYDPQWMGFGHLRVLNEDWVAPGAGFPMHPHRDMEIVTYMLEGALEHRDSTGGGSVIRAGVVQRMTAGKGIYHSETNPSSNEAAHLIQIWIFPRERGLEPGYEEKIVHGDGAGGGFRLIASPDGRDGSVTIQQDVDLFAGKLPQGAEFRHALQPGHKAWVQIARGTVTLNGQRLSAGDGAGLWDEAALDIRAGDDAELLLLDMTM